MKPTGHHLGLLFTFVLFFSGCITRTYTVTQADRLGGYAVAVSEATLNDPEWQDVVQALELKYHGAQRVVWKNDITEIKTPLSQTLPRYTCFVVRPEEAGHAFTVTVSRLMRQLDDDPYVDSFWGVLTGYEAADALRIVNRREPLVLERALDCISVNMSAYPFVRQYDENHRGTMKTRDGLTAETLTEPCDSDNTLGVLAMLQDKKVQFLTTSAHATQHDWHMGYKGPNLVLTHKDGHLIATDTKKVARPADCPEPKVYIAAGNCLIGDIDRRDCMATAWIHSGGAYQFVGYTVPTWFGAMGWGTLGLFNDTPGLYTCAEAFHFNNTRIVRRLEDINPAYASRNPATYETGKLAALVQPESQEKFKTSGFGAVKEEVGNLFDRDVVCFYGDPAWRATPPPQFAVKSNAVGHPGERDLTLIVTVTPKTDGHWRDEGVFVSLPGSFEIDAENATVSQTGLQPFYADNFIHLPLKGDYKAGESISITVPATRKGSTK